MTNGEWLDYLAQNAPDELAAWFDAEHVENQEQALDGDTEPENADSRDKIEADVRDIAEAYNMDTQRHGTERFAHELYYSIIHLLDRQAAITEREFRKPNWDYCETCETLAELTAERDTLQGALDIAVQNESKLEAERDELQAQVDELTAERDKLKELNEYHALQYELASEDADRLQAQVDRLTAERDELQAEIAKYEHDCGLLFDEKHKLTTDAQRWADAANRQRLVAMEQADKVQGLVDERDNLKANNQQLHTLAGEQAALIDELQKQVDELTNVGRKMSTELANMQDYITKVRAGRERYRSMCSEMATKIHDALMVMDEGMA